MKCDLLITLCGLALLASAAIARDPTPAERADILKDTLGREPDTKIATIEGRVVRGADLEPSAEWRKKRAERIRTRGVTLGMVSPDEHRKSRFFKLVTGPLIADYRKQHHIEPTKAEVDQFVVQLRRSTEARLEKQSVELEQARKEAKAIQDRLQAGDVSDAERRTLDPQLEKLEPRIRVRERSLRKGLPDETQTRAYAQMYLKRFKLQQALYKQYGGRVIFQQAGPEALDGMRKFFEEQQAAGKFAIHDPEYKKIFWAYYEKQHTAIPGNALDGPAWRNFVQPSEAE